MKSDVSCQVIIHVLKDCMKNNMRMNQEFTVQDLIGLCKKTKNILQKEPMLLELNIGLVVVGDIHGNLQDLIRIFEACGYPPEKNFLFLGDYVDRGRCSLEVISFLFALKCLYPESIYLLRGNHETEGICSSYGFSKQLNELYHSDKLFLSFVDVFSYLSFAAIIKGRIFCLHGCIPQGLEKLSELNSFTKPVKEKVLPSLLEQIAWNDPTENGSGFSINKRGIGFCVGSDAVKDFLHKFNLELIIRSHEYKLKGYEWSYSQSHNMITIFSTTDYCSRQNSASVLIIDEQLKVEIQTFTPLLTPEETRKRRIILPSWIFELLTSNDELQNSPCYSPTLAVDLHPSQDFSF